MKAPRLLAALAVLAAVALLARSWLLHAPEPRPPEPEPVGGSRDAGVPGAAGPGSIPAPDERTAEPRLEGSAPAASFRCLDEDGNPIADAVRDGLVLSLRTRDGTPCADVAVDVTWRKGFGLYGHDIGATDIAGRFCTTVARTDQFEMLEFRHERLGELAFTGPLLVSATDPRVVEMIVPDLGPLRVRVVDGRGQAIGGAKVTANGGAQNDVPRQHVLVPKTSNEGATNGDGDVVLLVPHGLYEISAEADDCTAPQAVRATVGMGGGDATVVLLRAEHRIDVDVRIVLPEGVAAPRVSAWTQDAPARAATMPGRGLAPKRREFFVDRQSDRHFVVRAEDVAWQVQATAQGCMAAIADVPRGQREVALRLAPMPPPASEPPKARLLVTVLGVDGSPASAEVRVHETPDFVYGSDFATNEGRVVIEREPKGRVCVSARAFMFPWTVSEAIDLAPGDHEVTLRLQAAKPVFGRVVDAQGNGVQTRVVLKRPAGALRGLAAGVPEILDHAPTSDSRGGGLDGRFQFVDCGPGEHIVWAFPEHGWPARRRVQPGVEATIVLGEGLDDFVLVHGVVRDETTLAPLPGVVVTASTDAGGGHDETDAEGKFRLVASPGAAVVRMRKRGYVFHSLTTQALRPGPAQLDLRLPPSPVLFVRVLGADGMPVEGAEVAVLGHDGKPLDLLDDAGNRGDSSERTNALGRADLRGAPAGALRILVERGKETREFDVPATAGRAAVFEVRW